MYETFYGLSDTPFRLNADCKFCFTHSGYKQALDCLRTSLEQGAGVVLLTGLSGSGKTLLCRDLISRFDENEYIAVDIMSNQLPAEEFLRKIALELGLPAEGYNETTLLSSLHDCMKDMYQVGKRLIVFLDEAHNLQTNSFAELRLLSTLQDVPWSVLQMVLVGYPQLQDIVLEADIAHIKHGNIITCDIDTMSVGQTEAYIKHRLQLVGWKNDPVIAKTVYLLIYDVSQGLARSVNQVMSYLLFYAAFENKHTIENEDALSVIQILIDEDRLMDSRHIESHIDQRDVEESALHQIEIDHEGINLSSGDEDILPDTEWLFGNDAPSLKRDKTPMISHGFSAGVPSSGFREQAIERESKWGGVWWMSSGASFDSGKNAKNSIRRMQLHQVVAPSDELPSITIERCPEMMSESDPVWSDLMSRHSGGRYMVLMIAVFLGILAILWLY